MSFANSPIAEKALVVACAIALGAGLVGAFVGLAVNSFWSDELFTVWVVGTDGDFGAAFRRALTDTHPPAYYMSLWAFAQGFGGSETGLRSFSAICSVAALLLFVIGTARVYSLPARLLAAALATVSSFWFIQAQNARPYGLAMLTGTALLVLALRLVERTRAGAATTPTLVALLAVAGVGIFFHWYMLFLALAVMIALALWCPRRRIVLGLAGLVFIAITFVYVREVVRPNSIFMLEGSWIKSNPRWYLRQTATALPSTITGVPAALIMLLMLAAAATGRSLAPLRGFGAVWRRVGAGVAGLPPRLLPLAVPPLLLAAGVASSVLMTPNFTTRNLLVATPFLWASIALLYDLGVARLPVRRAPVMAALAALILVASARVTDRDVPFNPPIRDSARFIDAYAGCRGAVIPVFTARRSPMKPGEAERHIRADYGYYLTDPAKTLQTVFVEDLAAGTARPAPTCAVVGWRVHAAVDGSAAETVRRQLEPLLGRRVRIVKFGVANDPRGRRAAYVYVAD